MKSENRLKHWSQVILSSLLASLFAAQSAIANNECDLRYIADAVKTISILRQVENPLNTLALPGATRVYAGTTVVILNEARADAYTAMAELEQPISLAGHRCK